MRFLSPARFLSLSFATLLLLGFQPCSAQSPPTRKTPPQHPLPAATDQERIIPYWTTETGWRSELQLRNNQNIDLTVTPVLRSTDGTETSLSPVTVKPREVKSIDLATAIGTSAPQLIGTYGSLVLRYHSTSSANLYPVLMVRSIGHSIAFHIDGMDESQDFQAGGREGIWWLPSNSASDYLILTNQGANAMLLDLSLFDSTGKASTQKVILTPRATNRVSVRQLLTATGLSGSYGGIKVSASSHAGSLDTLHVLFDQNAGFSAVMKMFDYKPTAQINERDYAKTGVWTLRAPMLALSSPDPALAFPVGTTLHPQLFVRNTTAKPVDAALVFNWRSDSAIGKASGPALYLNAYETRRVDVAALQDGKTLPQDAHWTSVTLTTNSNPDEIMAVAASYDATLHYGAQTPFTDQLSRGWNGGQWEYDAQHDSIITAGNGGTDAVQAAFTIHYNQGTQKYELAQTLQPDEQMWIYIGKLIREHIPDKNGNVLPADVTSGSFELRDLTHKASGTLFEGKIVFDRTYGHVTYGCSLCCGFLKPGTLWTDPLGIPFGAGAPQGVDVYDNCGGYWIDGSDSFYGGWSTRNTAIATVDYYATHTGVSAGSTMSDAYGFMQAQDNRNDCPNERLHPSGGDNVPPTVSVTCTPTNLAMGPTAPASTTNGSCSTQVSPSGGTYSWSASKNTITMSGTNTGAIGFTPASPSSSQGDTTITVKYTVNSQSATATSSAITTHNPTALTILSDTTNPNGYTCTNIPCLLNPGDGTCNASNSTCGYTSYLRVRQYSVLDQLSPPNQFADAGISLATVTESVPSTSSCPGITLQTGSSTQTKFSDSFYLCSTCCLPEGPGCSCQTNPVQTIYVNGIAVRTETLNLTCTTVTLTP